MVAINRYRIGVRLPCRICSLCPLPRRALRARARNRHCGRNRDKIMQRAALLAIPAVESHSFRVIVLKSDSSRHLRCQNAPAAIIGAKGLLDAVSKLRRAWLTGLVLEGAPTRANSQACGQGPRSELQSFLRYPSHAGSPRPCQAARRPLATMPLSSVTTQGAPTSLS